MGSNWAIEDFISSKRTLKSVVWQTVEDLRTAGVYLKKVNADNQTRTTPDEVSRKLLNLNAPQIKQAEILRCSSCTDNLFLYCSCRWQQEITHAL